MRTSSGSVSVDNDAPEKQLPTSIISQDSLVTSAGGSWERAPDAPGIERVSSALVLLILTPKAGWSG
jgi:hypothetical protein